MIQFLREFASNPTVIGAIAPSSRWLAKEMIAGLELEQANAVLEYGAGTGAFTPYIASAVSPSCKVVAIELNPSFVERFRSKFPEVALYNGSVAEARQVCNMHGISIADCIISGLPWAAFPRSVQESFLDEMMRVLRPGGRFATFAYLTGLLLPSGRHFAKLLPKYFSEVTRSRVVWPNLPPAFVYRCQR